MLFWLIYLDCACFTTYGYELVEWWIDAALPKPVLFLCTPGVADHRIDEALLYGRRWHSTKTGHKTTITILENKTKNR